MISTVLCSIRTTSPKFVLNMTKQKHQCPFAEQYRVVAYLEHIKFDFLRLQLRSIQNTLISIYLFLLSFFVTHNLKI